MRKQTKLVAVMSAAALLAIGASMTSFAATKGWVEENGVWMYLDSDGDAVTEDWKKSGSQYFWLDENGEMATDTLVEDDDDKYYVDSNGARVVNQWRQVDNEDGWTNKDSDEEPESVWYYFGSNGKAVTGKKTINGKTYFFDEGSEMFYGWYTHETTNNTKDYYLGDENEGWAFTGWHWLELKDELQDGDEYDDDEYWFHFKSSGEMRKSSTGAYINGAYYGFDENGVMVDGWRPAPEGANSSATATANKFYTEENGNVTKGWVFTYTYKDWENKDNDEEWFYLDSKGKPFNVGGYYKNDRDNSISGIEAVKYKEGSASKDSYGNVAAKVIKKKTYLFDETGMMVHGVIKLDGNTPRVGGTELEAGFYYFNKNSGSVKGQMEKGKVTVNYDGENYYYNFDKSTGKAYTNMVVDSCLYNKNGVRIDADDSKEIYTINDEDFADDIAVKGIANITLHPGDRVVVSTSGKLKKSGSVKIDGETVKLEGYIIVEN